jgi:CheY-like chemotaxis protein
MLTAATMRALLLVDDDDALPLLLQHAIKQSGLEIDLHSVGDGEEAVLYLDRKGEYEDEGKHPFPSLILLDLKMPRMNGFELLEWKRLQPQLEKVPVVAWSSSCLDADKARALQLGASSYFVKPMDTREFRTLLKSLDAYCQTSVVPS